LGLGCDGAGCWARLLEFVLERGAYEGGEEGVRLGGFGFELGVELAAEDPRVVWGFDDFDLVVVGSTAGDAESGGGQSFFVFAIEFVTVAVAFADFRFAVGLVCE